MENRIDAPYFVSLLQFLSPSVVLLVVSYVNYYFHVIDSFPRIKYLFPYGLMIECRFTTFFPCFPCHCSFVQWLQ